MIARRPRREAQETLADALLSLAGSLQDSASPDDALSRLTGRLAERDIACAVLVETAEGFRLERSTLPFGPDVWGRPLRLPRLARLLGRSRPTALNDISGAFTEATAGGERSLLTGRISGTLIAAPIKLAADGLGVICLVGRELREADSTAVWALALQVGAALRGAPESSTAAVPASSATGAASADSSLFHDLTQRLSYSLSSEGVVQAALETVAPALEFAHALTVSCPGDEDRTVVYAATELHGDGAATAAAGVLDAFLNLTGSRHKSCARPPYKTVTLAIAGVASQQDGRPTSILDAPLVLEGEVAGLLRIVSTREGGFDAEQARLFFTVANQISLALERIGAQQRAERAHLASLAESLTDGIVLTDRELRITSLNRVGREHLVELLGREASEGDSLAGTRLADLARAALTSQRQTAQEELAGGSAGAGRRYLMAMSAPLAGSPEGSAAVIVLRDVTEERLMQERLLQSEKMVSVGQLVSGVAHELNNPLTGIMGFAQLLLQRGLDESTTRDLQTIYTEAERAAKIVQNLLTFARRRRAEKELASLNVLLERVLELRAYDLRVKNIELELDLDSKLPDTMVDANQIQQVFFNVSVNAEQAMLAAHGRGTLTVRTRKENDVIRVSFHDDGAGMAPETLRRIFDPFFTTKDIGEGTGLGLTISYGIIDEHGGRIWAESQPGRGATFIIELPIVQGQAVTRHPEAEEPESAVAPRSILVVDDEQSIQRLLGSILELDGHQVDTARNGREALERIGRRRYDVIITDIKMPDMDGRELYQRLLNMDRALAHRTIFITGDTVSPDTRTFLQRVNNPCLTKPFRVREVRDTISQILAEGS